MGKTLGKILLFALVGVSTALFDRHLQICNRGGRRVSCDCVTPVGSGNCLDAAQKTYNRCVKADNTLTLQKCKERAESILNRELRGIAFANFKDNRACSIFFDVGVNLEENCPTDFSKVTGFWEVVVSLRRTIRLPISPAVDANDTWKGPECDKARLHILRPWLETNFYTLQLCVRE